MALLLPIISFLIGYLGVQTLTKIRPLLAMLLAKLFIPLIIVYNMVFYKQGSLWLIAFSLLCSIIFFGLFYVFQKDKLRALCFSYLNGAWLGFPFALAVFGPAASSTIVALYIGGSLFGNVCAVMAVNNGPQDARLMLKNMLFSPPVMALFIAAVLSIWDFSAFEQHALIQLIYASDKFLVTFSGMCILGMWLSKVSIGWADLKRSMILILSRSIIAIPLCTFAYAVLPIPHEYLIYAVMMMFFMLPPAANIVALETHYQGTGYSAQYIASGTIASALIIGCYAVLIHVIVPSL